MIERIWRSKTVSQQRSKHNGEQQNADPHHMETSQEELHLPNSIGCKIIQMQMQIQEGTLTKDTLIALLQEYTKAVEFYEEKGDQRYKLYQKKMSNFLQKEAVDAVLKGRQNIGAMMIKKEKAQQQIRKATNQSKSQVKQLLQNSEVDAIKQKNQIEKQVNRQMQSLQRRLSDKRSNSQYRKNKQHNKDIAGGLYGEDPKLKILNQTTGVPKIPRPKKTMMGRI